MTRTRLLAAGALALAVLGAAVIGAPAPTAGAGPGGCARRDASGKCIVENGDHGPGQPGGGGGSGGTWSCLWTGPIDTAVGRAAWPDAPEYAGYWLYEDCGTNGGNNRYDPWERVGYLTGNWMDAMDVVAQPVAAPPPGEVAADLWSRVEATLPAPAPVVSPPPGRAAIVDQPAFVAVGNWTTVNESDCDDVVGLVCVTLVAEPHLSFDPGDGSGAIACAGSGTVFDPSGDPGAQADAAGACAHRYGARTGAEGRPDAWAGSVTVTWEVSWSSANPDAAGTFDDFSLSTSIDRPVDEVQSIVVDADEGLG